MKIHLLCKRYYTNKDLLLDRFGRLYHLPIQMNRLGSDVKVTAIDYRNSVANHQELEGLLFVSLPATPTHIATSLLRIHRLFRNDKPDVIIASGDSHIGFLGLWLARDFGVPFVYDVYDYYPAF